MKGRRRSLRLAARFVRDRRGIAATEFAVIVPIMLVLFFGVVEVTNGIVAYRDVSIMAHTTSDLTTQSLSVQDRLALLCGRSASSSVNASQRRRSFARS